MVQGLPEKGGGEEIVYMLTANAPRQIGFSTAAGKVSEKGGGQGSSEKEFKTFKRGAEGPHFQKTLTHFDLPYDYKERAQLEKGIPVE
jgi:hypothetical protein